MHQQNINQAKQLYKAFWVTGTAFFMWELELFYTRLKRNTETARQKMYMIVHVPTQIYVNKTYIPHYNLAIIYIYFVEYIFFYIFFTFG
jgi:hypothetical protein